MSHKAHHFQLTSTLQAVPLKGVLGSFGQAFQLNYNDNRCLMIKEDLRQFGKLMETVVIYCSPGEASLEKATKNAI